MSEAQNRRFDATDSVHPECADVRALMLEDAHRELSEFELRRIEQHVSGCSACTAELEGTGDLQGIGDFETSGAGLDPQLLATASREQLFAATAPPPVSDDEWEDLRADLFAEIEDERPRAPAASGSSSEITSTPKPSPPGLPPGFRWWKAVLPTAAALLLAWLMWNPSNPAAPAADPLGGSEQTGSPPWGHQASLRTGDAPAIDIDMDQLFAGAQGEEIEILDVPEGEDFSVFTGDEPEDGVIILIAW